MLDLLQMWALVEVLGFVCLPLTITVFHNLPDRGWAFSKIMGVIVLAFIVWLPLMLLHALPFSQDFILGMLLILVAFNVMGFLRARHTLVKLVRANFLYILSCEVVFLGMVFLLGWLRSFNPNIQSFEMFMDEGFLASIMRSPHFPPSDMWLSGYSINYYYYAHYTIALLAKLLGQTPSIAFNTGICTLFGLTAINLFAVTCNIVSWARHRRERTSLPALAPNDAELVERPATSFPSMLRSLPYGLLTMLMGLVLGNLAATQQWWENHASDLRDFSLFNWWAPSRVIPNTINEFPAFSFILDCFHAHVLTLAFTVVAIALAFNLFLEPEGKGIFVFGRGWRLIFTLFATAIVLGGLFTMNGWDLPTYVCLALLCIILQQWSSYKGRLRLELLLDIFTACSSLVALSFLLYAPFYLHFISPSLGIGIVLAQDRSPLAGEILIFGMFAFIFLSLLLATLLRPLFQSTHVSETGNVAGLADVSSREPPARDGWMVGLTWAVCIALAALLLYAVVRNSTTLVLAVAIAASGFLLILYNLRERSLSFTLLLGSTAFFLIGLCEVVYLKDVFADQAPRMNTIFKFYFQAWALLAITSGAGIYFILQAFRPVDVISRWQNWLQRSVGLLWNVGLLLLLVSSMAYPIFGTYARYVNTGYNPKTNNPYHYFQHINSLDGLAYMQTCAPPMCDYIASGDYYAIRWLNANIAGNPVIVEGVGGDYSDYARVSAFTGLPTIMGWVGHEYQWRVNWLNNGRNATDFDNRKGDVDLIYTNTDPQLVLSTLANYHATYLYVGELEQRLYPQANLHRFSAYMQIVYQYEDVTIYKVK